MVIRLIGLTIGEKEGIIKYAGIALFVQFLYSWCRGNFMGYGVAIFKDAEVVGVERRCGGTVRGPILFWVCIIMVGGNRYEILDYRVDSTFEFLHIKKRYIFECDIMLRKRTLLPYFVIKGIYFRAGGKGHRYRVKRRE